jgi:hypothetical protein
VEPRCSKVGCFSTKKTSRHSLERPRAVTSPPGPAPITIAVISRGGQKADFFDAMTRGTARGNPRKKKQNRENTFRCEQERCQGLSSSLERSFCKFRDHVERMWVIATSEAATNLKLQKDRCHGIFGRVRAGGPYVVLCSKTQHNILVTKCWMS